jgi:MFS family permease
MAGVRKGGADSATVARPRAARAATAAVFALHAALFASWTPHVPLVKEHLGLSAGALGFALLGAPVGSVAATLLAGAAVSRWGSRRVMLVTLLCYAASSVGLGLANSAAALFAAMLVWGGFQGALDIAMNAQGVAVERRYGRSILASFHAAWSIGGFAGTGVGVLALSAGVDLTTQMAVFGGVGVLAAGPLMRPLLADDGAADEHGLEWPWRDRRLAVLAGLMFAGLLCEGAAADWAAVYLRDSLAAPAQLAGSGYAAFAVAMFAGRALGDRWVARFGGLRVVGVLAAVGALGMGVTLLVGVPWLALLGLAAFGLGLSCIVPVVFSSAAAVSAAHPGRAIAGVVTGGWAGFLLGPPLIGLLAQSVSLPWALALLPVLCGMVVVTARLAAPARA